MSLRGKSNVVQQWNMFSIVFHIALWIALVAALKMFFFNLGWQSLNTIASGLNSETITSEFANRDFVNYWMAGRLALSGDLSPLFLQEVYQQKLESTFGFELETRNWSYPPHSLLLLWPLGLISFKQAFFLFQVSTLALFIWSVWRFAVSEPYKVKSRSLLIIALLLIPFVISQIAYSQNGFLYASLFILFLHYRTRSDLLSGFILALMTTKPQLGLLIPLLLLVERRFILILYASAFTIALIGISVLVFGTKPWLDFWTATIPYQHYVTTNWQGIFWGMMPTVFGSMRHYGFNYDTAILVHLVFAFVALVLLLVSHLRENDSEISAVVVLAATFCILPYAFFYDMGALFAVAAVLLALKLEFRDTISLQESTLYHLLFMMPLLMPFTYSEGAGLKLLYFIFPAVAFSYFLTVIHLKLSPK